MPYKVQPGVIGCAIRPAIAGRDRSLEEIIYDTTQQALADAGLTIEDIDGIVVGCNDQFDGRAISVMMASGAVGGVDRDILSTPSGSEHAFILGALRVASGQFRTQLVVAWSPTEASSHPGGRAARRRSVFPPRAAAGRTVRARAAGGGAGTHGAWRARMSRRRSLAKNRRHGALAYPDPPVRAAARAGALAADAGNDHEPGDRVRGDGAGHGGLHRRTQACRRGLDARHGLGDGTSFLGDRDLSTAPALQAAARQAYAEAGITDPLTQLDVVEITDATPYAELLAYEALGLCAAARLGSARRPTAHSRAAASCRSTCPAACRPSTRCSAPA